MSQAKALKNLVSKDVMDEIDRWLQKYPKDQKQSAVLIALRLVQIENKGHLTETLMNAVADYLEMPRIAVYENATFYSYFNLQPVGKYRLHVCSNLSCMLMGFEPILAYLEQKLGIKAGETTADGLFTLVKEVECLAACGHGPVMQVNSQQVYENLTPGKIDQIIDDFTKARGVNQ